MLDFEFTFKMEYSRLYVVCLLMLISTAFLNAQSLCSYEFKTSSKTELNTGTIEVSVNAKTAFSVELHSYQGIEKEVIQTKTGVGKEKIVFNSLPIVNGRSYRVAVVVSEENNFLCKKKISEEIFFDIN